MPEPALPPDSLGASRHRGLEFRVADSIDRRRFLAALSALAVSPRILAQAPSGSQFRVNGLSQITLTVSDVARSLEFYQGLFGMPIQARQGSAVLLRIGSGPRFLALRP